MLNTNGIVSAAADSMLTASGRIEAIAPVVLEGTTHYYICLENNEDIFDVDMSQENLIGIVRYKEGDSIKLTYMEGYGLNAVRGIE